MDAERDVATQVATGSASPTALHWAGWLGEHALPAYGVGLGLVMTAVVLVWVTLRRYGRPHEQGRLPPAAFLLLYLGLGFALIVSTSMLFVEIAEALSDGQETLGLLDERLTASVRDTVSTTTLRAFALVTRLGDRETLIGLAALVAAVLLWRGRRRLALVWLVGLAGNAVLNPTLKSVFERVRPLHDHGIATADGWSFPSGHSSGAVVTYGMLAYVAVRTLPGRWHLPVLLGAAALAFTIGCSRIFLQVHYASDVLAGFASGTCWLAVCIGSVELMRRRSLWRQWGRPGITP